MVLFTPPLQDAGLVLQGLCHGDHRVEVLRIEGPRSAQRTVTRERSALPGDWAFPLGIGRTPGGGGRVPERERRSGRDLRRDHGGTRADL